MVPDPEQRDDGGLVHGDAVEVAHRRLLIRRSMPDVTDVVLNCRTTEIDGSRSQYPNVLDPECYALQLRCDRAECFRLLSGQYNIVPSFVCRSDLDGSPTS